MTEETKKSELELLLEKNAYGEGLRNEEIARAKKLIATPEYTEGGNCWLCKSDAIKSPAIYDTGLCQEHALYALATRK